MEPVRPDVDAASSSSGDLSNPDSGKGASEEGDASQNQPNGILVILLSIIRLIHDKCSLHIKGSAQQALVNTWEGGLLGHGSPAMWVWIEQCTWQLSEIIFN